jgi:hypothetical protein
MGTRTGARSSLEASKRSRGVASLDQIIIEQENIVDWTSRFATGTVLLLALAGCTDNMAGRSQPAAPAGTSPSGLGQDQVICPPGSQQPECLRPRTNPDD